MIEYSIVESIEQTLINSADLKKYVEKRDIYKGCPSSEQNISKNLLVIEPGKLVNTDSRKISSTEKQYAFSFDMTVYVGYTQETKQEGVEKFLELIAYTANAIELSTYIAANSYIKSFEINEIDKDFYLDERLLFRQAEINLTFIGIYKAGNL